MLEEDNFNLEFHFAKCEHGFPHVLYSRIEKDTIINDLNQHK